MKKFRKILSVVLTLVMVLAMAVPGFAAITEQEGTFSITINDDNKDNEYKAYQIFSGKLAKDDKGTTDDEDAEDDDSYILSDIVWGSGIDEARISDLLNDLSTVGIIASTDNTAALVAKKLTNLNIDAAAEKIVKYLSDTNSSPLGYNSGLKNHSVGNLAPGYYLIKQTKSTGNGEAFSKYIVQVVADVNMAPKSEAPTVEKKIVEGTSLVDVTDLSIGDNVEFKITVTLPERITDYDKYELEIVDTMSDKLTYNGDATIAFNGADEGDYLFNDADDDQDGKDYPFENSELNPLTFTCDDILDVVGIDTNKTIILTYTATLNKDAVIGGTGNTNTVKLNYSNNPYDESSVNSTPEDTVWVFTYELDGEKVDANNVTTKLPGAEFVLYRTDDQGIKKYRMVNNAGSVSWVVDSAAKDESGEYIADVKLTSGQDGKIEVKGLAAGTYYLEEIKAPTGYNLLPSPITLEILATELYNEETETCSVVSLKIRVNDEVNGEGNPVYVDGATDTGIVNITIKNNQGTQLPSTGGMGTTIFYAAGIVLMADAAFFVVRRKRA